MSKQILYQDNARRALQRGMEIMVEAVSVTLGPKGRNVVLEKPYGSPQIINDGVTIAKEITLENHVENTGVSLIRQAASKTNDVAGDGTTTATVLAYAIVKEGLKNVAAGSNPIGIKLGIEKATQYLINQINEFAESVEDLDSIFQVASISAGNDPTIGQLISDALEKVGKDGVIALEEAKGISTELEITEGMKIEKGFISPYFITDTDKMEVVYDNPLILVTDKRITLVQQDLLPILELATKTKRPLLIIAEDVEKEALATLILNKLRGIVNVVAIRAPSFGELRKLLLEDIAILTNSTIITEDAGLNLENIKMDFLGQARRVVVGKETTTIVAESTENAIKLAKENPNNVIGASIMLSRGCPFKCTFCTTNTVHGYSMRYPSNEKVINQLTYLIRENGFDTIIIEDDLFAAHRKRFISLADEIIKQEYSVKFFLPQGLSVGVMNETVIDAMLKMGIDEELYIPINNTIYWTSKRSGVTIRYRAYRIREERKAYSLLAKKPLAEVYIFLNKENHGSCIGMIKGNKKL